MKKIIALMMALAMLLTVAGCGGSNNTASTASTPAADTAPAGDASTPAASAPAASAPSGDTSASPVAGKKVAYIMQMGAFRHFPDVVRVRGENRGGSRHGVSGVLLQRFGYHLAGYCFPVRFRRL